MVYCHKLLSSFVQVILIPFLRYVKERAEEERREKRNKLKERKDDFRALLESSSLTGKSTFTEFSSKFSKDERFKNIEKMRERESLFDEYLLEVRRREKEEKIAKREQVRASLSLANRTMYSRSGVAAAPVASAV